MHSACDIGDVAPGVSTPSEQIAMSVAALREAIEHMPNGPVVPGPYFAHGPLLGVTESSAGPLMWTKLFGGPLRES
jgi:hypothetical protein